MESTLNPDKLRTFLIKYMNKRCITVNELSIQIGISNNAINDFIYSKSLTSGKTIFKIINFFIYKQLLKFTFHEIV